MEVSIKREDLLRGLHQVQGVVERRNTLPILANVLMEPAEGGLALTATDMEVGLRTRVTGKVKTKGSITLNARKLYEIVREVAAEEITIRAVAPGWVELLAGRSKFKVVSLDAKDFPELPLGAAESGGVPLRVASGTLREMIDKTLFAVSTDETRFNLSGVYAETGENGVLRMVATDGHRLAMIERSLKEAKLPRGAIHADLFCDNVLFVGDRVSGIIDFGFAATDFLAYDLAITVNDWCITDEGDARGEFVPELVSALIAAYQTVRPLNADERAQWSALLRARPR